MPVIVMVTTREPARGGDFTEKTRPIEFPQFDSIAEIVKAVDSGEIVLCNHLTFDRYSREIIGRSERAFQRDGWIRLALPMKNRPFWEKGKAA